MARASPEIPRPFCPSMPFREFNVQGKCPGRIWMETRRVINVGLKSGTNSIHGTAFAFGRDGDVLDARNYFNADPAAKTPRTLEQFGGSFGGAIYQRQGFLLWCLRGPALRRRKQLQCQHSHHCRFTYPSTPTCTSVAGDCANSIPMQSPDLLANHVPISHASQLISAARSREPALSRAMALASRSTTRNRSMSCRVSPTMWGSTT